MTRSVPAIRIRALNRAGIRGDGEFVLYWMTANRRLTDNFALQRAAEWAESLRKPLVVLEALRSGYAWASDRLHRFVLQGMVANQRAAQGLSLTYYPYVETRAEAGKGLVETLSQQACVVVADDFPCFFLPRMLAALARRISVACEAVDSNGILPMRAATGIYPTAYAFRRFLQRELPHHLEEFPAREPLRERPIPRMAELPAAVVQRWPPAGPRLLAASREALRELPIDHRVFPASFDGGAEVAEAKLARFVELRLPEYLEKRSEPEADAASGLSPYLHFGHISVHAVFRAIASREGWSAQGARGKANGQREGWWGMRPEAEGFLDELITWRELGYNLCWQREDYDQYDSLPDWARKSLADHAGDPRLPSYDLATMEGARTHDRLWNAAQTQLVREGRMHNYLRMLWGKKILEWSPSPQDALDVLIHLNNKYAVDGRNPNSYSGIFWCLGRYDRPWGPERPIFGKIRYMSSDNTARKFSVTRYLDRYSADDARDLPLFRTST